MTSRLRVVIVGEREDTSPCDTYRGGMFVEPLARRGIDLDYVSPSVGHEGLLDEAELLRGQEAALARLDGAVETADVVVFRRAYTSMMLCLACPFAAREPSDATQHVVETGHHLAAAPSASVRHLFDRIEHDEAFGRDHAIVYETDDDMLRVDADNAIGRSVNHEADLIGRILARADLAITSTPVLAGRLGPHTTAVQVVRNAIDPAWYELEDDAAADSRGGRARILFYGSLGRMRDYAVCADGVASLKRGAIRRIWLGAPSLGTDAHAAKFDEIHEYVLGAPQFAHRLAELRPDIGLAPLSGTDYDRAKSELHWLEYAMAGAVTVASGLDGPGPYDPIRNGVDGIVVRDRMGWSAALRRLVASKNLRAELAGRARERVLAEYTIEHRADEWAAAFHLAADQRGRGLATASRFAARRAEAPATPAPAPTTVPTGEAPVASKPSSVPNAADLLAAFAAAAQFTARQPLTLVVGRDGSTATGPAGLDDVVRVDTAGTPDVRFDVRFGLPFPDDSCAAVDVRGVLDNEPGIAPVVLVEARRVLTADGLLRIHAADRAAALERSRRLSLQGVALLGNAARLPAFDRATLADALAAAGFTAITEEPAADDAFVLVATR